MYSIPVPRYTELTLPENVRAAFAAAHTTMYIQDDGPYKVVLSCLEKMGYVLGVTDTNSFVLVIRRANRKASVRQITLPKMLYICKENSQKRQSKPYSMYQRMCAEEDESEIDLLLEKYYKANPNVRKAQPKETPMHEEPEVKPAVVNISEFRSSKGVILLPDTKEKRTETAPPWVLF